MSEFTNDITSLPVFASSSIFDSSFCLLGGSYCPPEEEMGPFLTLFRDRTDTIARGLDFEGQHYDLFRFHPPVVFGRHGDPIAMEGRGIAVQVIHKEEEEGEGEEKEEGLIEQEGKRIFVVVTYEFPVNSAKAVPILNEFCDNYAKTL